MREWRAKYGIASTQKPAPASRAAAPNSAAATPRAVPALEQTADSMLAEFQKLPPEQQQKVYDDGVEAARQARINAADPHAVARLARAHIEEMAAEGLEVSDSEAVQHVLSLPPAAVARLAVATPSAEDASQEAAAEDASTLARAHDIASRARVYTAQMAALGIPVTASEAVRYVQEQM